MNQEACAWSTALSTAAGPPWENRRSVLLEVADHESQAHGRAVETAAEHACDRAWSPTPVIAESIAQSRGPVARAQSISLAQCEEGPNLKHDISLPVPPSRQFVEELDVLLLDRFPGLRHHQLWAPGDGNLHYNIQASKRLPRLCAACHLDEVTRLVYDAVHRYGGCFLGRTRHRQPEGHDCAGYKPAQLRMRADGEAQVGDGSTRFLNPGRVAFER
jgi:FAD/FMN-containing dehydrogenase